MPRPPLEKLSKVLRRQTQINAWRQSEKTVGATSLHGASDFPVRPEADPAAPPTAVSDGADALAVIRANRSLRLALAHGEAETPLTRQTARAIRCSSGKDAALRALDVLLRTDGASPTAATFEVLSAALLRHHVAARIGRGALAERLAECTDAARAQRWTPAEVSAFVRHVCRQTARWALRGSAFNALLGFTQEGADNDAVVRVEYQMRKSGARVSAEALADLMHLDLSWSTALRVYAHGAALHRVPPPMELTDRLMGLMTGYRTSGIGSRPWRRALALYASARASGYDLTLTTHTHALDALWRSVDDFHRVHAQTDAAQRAFAWTAAQAIRRRVEEAQLLVAGEEGCAYAESLVKVFAASGHWSEAVELVSGLETTRADTTRRLLVPTAETFAFAMAACGAAGHAAHVEALLSLFRESYTLRSLHPEVLLILFQSLRHLVRASPLPGALLEELLADGKGLDRPVAVAALQLLASPFVSTKQSRHALASALWEAYDANAWPQHPVARKTELQTVFRCLHRIAAMSAAGPLSDSSPDGVRRASLLPRLRAHLCAVFGAASAEVEWLDDTAVYALQRTADAETAVAIYRATVAQRRPERVPHLPIPLRQARAMLFEALLRAARAASEETFLLDESESEGTRRLPFDALRIVREVCRADDTVPHRVCAELALLRSAASGAERQAHARTAMRHISLDAADATRAETIRDIADALSLTEMHVEHALRHGHAALRFATLSRSGNKEDDTDSPKKVGEGFDVIVW